MANCGDGDHDRAHRSVCEQVTRGFETLEHNLFPTVGARRSPGKRDASCDVDRVMDHMRNWWTMAQGPF